MIHNGDKDMRSFGPPRVRATCVFIAVWLIGAIPAPAQSISFSERTIEAGLDRIFGAQGIAVADYNADGWDDLAVARTGLPFALFRNNGDGTFEDVASEVGVAAYDRGINPLWIDIANDGYPDLFVAGDDGSHRLYLNSGGGTFEDATERSGIDAPLTWATAAAGDYDTDGYVDLFAATLTGSDHLYRNTGEVRNDRIYKNVTDAAGVGGDNNARAMQASWIDYDHDGRLDLFVVNDADDRSLLYRNMGALPFRETAESAGIAEVGRGNSMGVAWGDFDRNGWEDVYITRISEAGLFLNDGRGSFINSTSSHDAHFSGVGWGAVAADFDNDGDEDLVASVNSWTTGTLLFENADGEFVNVTREAGATFRIPSVASAVGDFDNDGRVDLVFVSNEQLRLYMNASPESNNWIQLTLQGEHVNRMAIGARVVLFVNGKSIVRTVIAGSSWRSQISPRIHIGLGTASDVSDVVISWGESDSQLISGLSANTHHIIAENAGVITASEDVDSNQPSAGTLSIHPNPSNEMATFGFRLARSERVSLDLYDALGRHVERLAQDFLPAGEHDIRYDATALSPGVYFVCFTAGPMRSTRPMVIAR